MDQPSPRLRPGTQNDRHRKRQESRQIPILPDDSRHEPLESPDADTGNSGTTELPPFGPRYAATLFSMANRADRIHRIDRMTAGDHGRVELGGGDAGAEGDCMAVKNMCGEPVCQSMFFAAMGTSGARAASRSAMRPLHVLHGLCGDPVDPVHPVRQFAVAVIRVYSCSFVVLWLRFFACPS